MVRILPPTLLSVAALMSLMLRVVGADAQSCSTGRQHAARYHEAHRGASRLLAATEKGAGGLRLHQTLHPLTGADPSF